MKSDLAQNVNSAKVEKPDESSQNSIDSSYHLFLNVSVLFFF